MALESHIKSLRWIGTSVAASKRMKIVALPFVALAIVAIANCSSNGNSCPSANDITYGGACSIEGVTCDAKDFCNTGAPSQAVCRQGQWGAPAGCIEGGPGYSPCTQMGGTCSGTCAPGTHAVSAADACSTMESCCVPGDLDAGNDGGDASSDVTSDATSDAAASD